MYERGYYEEKGVCDMVLLCDSAAGVLIFSVLCVFFARCDSLKKEDFSLVVDFWAPVPC